MPEGEDQDVSAAAQTPTETDKERFERERLTRRQALKKFGLTAGMATFAMFSVDDLARMVGKAMQQRAGDNRVAGQIAREFQDSGAAFAGGPSWLCHACDDHCTPGPYQYCKSCGTWPCTGAILTNENCGDFNRSKCLACCQARNPSNIIAANSCISIGGCYFNAGP